MRSHLPLIVCCISLLHLQQLQAAFPGGNRLDFINQLPQGSETTALSSEVQPDVPSHHPSPKLLSFLRRLQASKIRRIPPALMWARPSEELGTGTRARRARRHAHFGSRRGHHSPHHAQLMRVGCVLGTCQVQNLSHRLYQLIGQGGRDDSSPMNPRSPHSYG